MRSSANSSGAGRPTAMWRTALGTRGSTSGRSSTAGARRRPWCAVLAEWADE